MDRDATSSQNNDAVEMLVEYVYSGTKVEKRRVSAIMGVLDNTSGDDDKKKFLDELEDVLDSNKVDPEISREYFSTVCKDLFFKHQGSAPVSPRTSPVKFFEVDLSPVKHESFSHSVTESEQSYRSSPSSDIYLENTRLQEEIHGLKFRLNILEEHEEELEKLLLKSEDRSSKLEKRCKDLESQCRTLEDFKTNYRPLLFENNNCGGDTKVDESRNKKHDLEINRLEEELFDAMEQIRIKDLEIEEMQSHADSLHKDFKIISERLIEKEECLEQKEQEIVKLKNCEKRLSETIQNLAEENETLKEAVKEQRSIPTAVDESLTEDNLHFRPMCLKDELGGSLPALNTSIDLDDSTSDLKCPTEETEQCRHSRNDLQGSLCFENNNAKSDSEEDEKKTKQFEDKVARLEEELTEAKANIAAKALELEEVQRYAQFCCQENEIILVNLEEKELYISDIEEKLANLKLKEKKLSGIVKHLEEANESRELAIERYQPANLSNPQQAVDPDHRENPRTHLSNWGVFLALVAYLLHNILLGYGLVVLVVICLTPYLNLNALARAKPWFMSVDASPGPPPV